jgi:hypothetical protein
MVKNSINTPALAAALTMAVTFLVHVFVGGPELYGPLRESSLTVLEKSTFSVVWHFTSLQLLLLAAVLFYLSKFRNNALFAYALATSVGFAILFIGYGLFDLGSVWPMPQWIAFVLTSALMIWGARKV